MGSERALVEHIVLLLVLRSHLMALYKQVYIYRTRGPGQDADELKKTVQLERAVCESILSPSVHFSFTFVTALHSIFAVHARLG